MDTGRQQLQIEANYSNILNIKKRLKYHSSIAAKLQFVKGPYGNLQLIV